MAKTSKNSKVVEYNMNQTVGNFDSAKMFEEYTNLNMKRLAAATNLNHQMFLKLQHMPVEGEIYDPTAINFKAIDEYVNKRLTPEQLDKINWEEFNTERTTKGGTFDLSDFVVGAKVKFRKDDKLYTIVVATDTHICVQEDETQTLMAKSATRLQTMGAKVVIDEVAAEAK